MKKKLFIIASLVIAIFCGISNVEASSYNISAYSSITKGSSTYLTISGNDVTGRFNITSSNPSVVSISEDRVWIENNRYSIKLSALSVGSSTITVTPSGVSDSDGNYVSLPTKTIRITVSLPREKSNDNNLRSLSIEGFDITPEFSKDIQAYNVVVPEDTKKIKVLASPNESHASIKGTGDIEVNSGINTVNVIVKSETGLEKIYTINVEVKDNNPIIVNLDNQEYSLVKIKENLPEVSGFTEAKITINGYEIPAYENKVADLILVGLKDTSGNIALYSYSAGKYSLYNEMKLNNLLLIPTSFEKELDLTKTTIKINNEDFTAYKYNDKSSLVVISAKSLKDGETSLYLYDPNNNTAIEYDEAYIKEINDTIQNYTYIIIAFTCALFIMFVLIFCLLHSIRKKQHKINKFVEKQEAKIEATRKLNDVVEEVKKITASEKKELEIPVPKKEEPKAKKKTKSSKEEKEVKASEVNIKEVQVSDPNSEIKKVLDDTEEVYDLFEDDKKKKKKIKNKK